MVTLHTVQRDTGVTHPEKYEGCVRPVWR